MQRLSGPENGEKMAWVLLLIAIMAEVIATSALKSTEGFSKILPSAIAVIGYVISFYFLSLTLKSLPIGITYAIWSGVGIILISVIGYFFYKQNLDAPAIIGIAFIIFGVAIINIFSKSIPH
jgi:small multidrug resistance pump